MYVFCTMGVSKESLSKFLIGNRFFFLQYLIKDFSFPFVSAHFRKAGLVEIPLSPIKNL